MVLRAIRPALGSPLHTASVGRNSRALGTMAVLREQNPFTMLRWTLTFLVIAIIAGILGFSGISAAAAGIAKVIFFIFLVLLVGSLILGASLFKKS